MKHIVIILTLILILPFLTQAAEITDGLVLYMPLDEGTGDKTEDKSKTNEEGEVKGAKLPRLPGFGSSAFRVHTPLCSAQGKVVVDVTLVSVMV